jgi:endonuclease/exonuclease/phosphatase family metal-dependent hydrolase
MSNKTKKRTKHKTKLKKGRKKRYNSTKYIQSGGNDLPTTVTALTYNLSWASQANVVLGSEEDFVRQCKKIKRDCYVKALEKIEELHSNYTFDVLGIQEVQHVDLVTTIMEKTNLTGWYRGATWNSEKKVYSGCALIWNTITLGTMKTGKTINLAKPDKDNICDARTCCIVTTSKDINLIVAHFPWINGEKDIEAITEIINAHISSNGPIIILTDANDGKTLISKEKPLLIKDKKLSHGLSQDQAKATLKTCCWHEKDNKNKWKHMTDTGDYILSENVTYIGIPIEKPSNDINESDLYSDHMPVMATISLKPQYTQQTKQQQTQKKQPWNSSTRIAQPPVVRL